MNDWKVQLVETPGIYGYQVYVYRPSFDRSREFITKGGTEIQRVEDSSAKDIDLTFATIEFDQLHALVEAFSSKGFKTTNDHKVEGLLEATKSHLEDMRSLVFKGAKK